MTTPELGQCPACHQWIQIPKLTGPSLLVCPWCDQQVDSLDVQRIPVRIARTDAGALLAEPESSTVSPPLEEDRVALPAETSKNADATANAEVQADVGTAAGGGVRASESRAPFAAETKLQDDDAVEVPSPFEIGPVEPRPRRTLTAGRNVGIEVVKIIAGGLAGLAIAQLILWWLPGVGRRDPLGISQHVPAWLSGLVPPELRSYPPLPLPPTQEPSTSDGAEQTEVRVWPPAFGLSRPSPTHGQPAADIGLVASTLTLECPAEIGCQATDDKELDVESHPAIHTVKYSGEQLQAAIASAVTALDQLEAAAGDTREQRLRLARALYQRLCELAEAASFGDPDDPYFGERMNAVDDLLRRLGRNESLLGLIGRTSASWIAYPARTSNGIALVGDVVGIEPRGALWETEMRLSSKTDTTIRVLTMLPPPLDPRMPYDVGSRLIVLGSVFSDLTADPSDFRQSATVWRGIHHAFETPERSAPPAPLDLPHPKGPVRY